MKTLTLQSGEALYIGGQTEIRILSKKSRRVKLGIVAPEDCEVWRSEVPLSDEDDSPHDLSCHSQIDFLGNQVFSSHLKRLLAIVFFRK
ncbi:carbon storage regulator [Nitrincola sp. MINF-07-Sa-05]|uniref:carbon storage regulator n=1 Tax=Nitrincola salilacus TaxID=3400273 RepID=UPI003917D8B1